MADTSNPTPSNPPLRVLLVEDHPLLCRCIRQLIETDERFRVCGESAMADHALELAVDLQPDLAVVDITLRAGNGFELVQSLRAKLPNIRVLMLSMHSEEMHAEHSLRSGAHGYLMKNEATENLIEALHHIANGEIWTSDPVRRKLSRSNPPIPVAPTLAEN